MELKNLYGKYKGESILVVGCGESRNLYHNLDLNNYHKTFGVNYINGFDIFTDWLLIVDPMTNAFEQSEDFKWRKKHMLEAVPDLFFSHLNDWDSMNYKDKVEYKLGTAELLNFNNKEGIVDHSLTSPYMACLLAYYLGFKTIDVIGCDFTNHPDLTKYKELIRENFKKLAFNCKHFGCSINSLSPNFSW